MASLLPRALRSTRVASMPSWLGKGRAFSNVALGSAEDIAAFAAMEPHPRSMKDLLSTVDPTKNAEFLLSEMPIRYAERIRYIENIFDWQRIPELASVHAMHMESFGDLRRSNLSNFAKVARELTRREHGVIELMAKSVHRLHQERGEDFGDCFVGKFLDDFILNRIGSQVLMGHYLACVARQPTGIVDRRCDTKSVCRLAARDILKMCEHYTGFMPLVDVHAHSSCGGSGLDAGDVPRFSYMPHVLKYVIGELLKNSCRATVEKATGRGVDLQSLPISVIICADEQHVSICVADQAGGIPRGVNVWSYLYTTAKTASSEEKNLAGHGVGLPMSRLYARYLGGSLDLVSLPGYGTHAYLNLPRVESEQVEVVPDSDHEYDYASFLDYTV